MSRGCSPEEKRFISKADELNYHQEWGQENGDFERVEAAKQVRDAIQAAGKSTSSIGHLSRQEAKIGGGKMALASYQERTDKINLGDLDTLRNLSKEIGQSVRETVSDILDHEEDHQRSHQAEFAHETDLTIAYLFGAQALHDIEEASASLGNTDHFDAYATERSNANHYASQLGISLLQLKEIRLYGKYEKLLACAEESNLLKNKEISVYLSPTSSQEKAANQSDDPNFSQIYNSPNSAQNNESANSEAY